MAVPEAATLSALASHMDVTSAGREAELTRVLRAATKLAEGHRNVGPIVIRAFTATRACSPGGDLVLPKRPVVSVDSITRVGFGGMPLPTTAVDVDAAAGIISRRGGFARGQYVVQYSAGRFARAEDVDEDLQLAVCIIAKQLWETQRGRGSRTGMLGGGDSEQQRTPAGFAVPHRAATLLASYTSPSVA